MRAEPMTSLTPKALYTLESIKTNITSYLLELGKDLIPSADLDSLLTLSFQGAETRLDKIPLTFGKYKGMLPTEVAKIKPSYLIWAFYNTKREVCSHELLKECKKDTADAQRAAEQEYAATAPHPVYRDEASIDDIY